MLRVIDDEYFIHEYQRIFAFKLKKDLTEERDAEIGFMGGSVYKQIIFDSRTQVWAYLSDERELFYSSHYWNPFGKQTTSNSKTVNSIVQLNFSPSCDRSVAGVFLKDEDEVIYVGHRGLIGGGKKGVGKKLFHKEYGGRIEQVDDCGRPADIAIVSELESPKLLENIIAFMNEVERIKQSVPSKSESSTHNKRIDLNLIMEKQLGFRPENEAISIYASTDREVQSNHLHGKVVNQLAEKLTSQGYSCHNTKPIDLIIVDEDKYEMSHIFEVKSDYTTQSVYTAIGQLFLNSTSKMRKILVIPKGLTDPKMVRIMELGIKIVEFSINEDVPEFTGLSEAISNNQ